MKKIVSALLSAAMIATMATGFAVSSSAEKTTHTLPFVAPSELPVIDGDSSDAAWAKGYQVTLDQNTDGYSISDFSTPTNPASAKISAFWSATVVNPKDDPNWMPDLDYDYNEDTKGGLYFKFDVTDTTQAFAAGTFGVGSPQANATDAVQVFLAPSVYGSKPPILNTKDTWIYSFTGYSAGGPGVGEIPSGVGFWWLHTMEVGGADTLLYRLKIATKMNVTFDPAYPHPGEAPDYSDSASEYNAWKKKLDEAYEHITDYQGYTVEVFIPWMAMTVSDTIPTPEAGSEVYMAFYLLDYYFDWENHINYDDVPSNQKINFTKASITDNTGRGNPLGRPRDNYDTYVFGAPYFPDDVDFVKGDATGDGAVKLNDVTAIAMHVAGIKAIEGTNLLAADATGDGDVKLNDVTAVAMHVAGIKPLN